MTRDDREDEALLELALHLETRPSAREQLAFLAERVTWRSAWPTLWRIATRGFLSPTLFAQQLANLADDAENARPDEIVAVLTQAPAELPHANTAPWLLENYPLALDALVMHAAHRTPTALSAVKDSLPANVRRALPLVERRLGLAAPAHLPELFTDLVKTQMRSSTGDVWVLSDGKLVRERLERLDQVAKMAALVAPDESLESAIVAMVPEGELPSPNWRLEPFYVSAPIERIFSLFDRYYVDSEFMLTVLARRQDPPESLFELLRRQQAKEGTINDWLAIAIARRLHDLGKPVPPELDAEVTFRSAPRTGDRRAWAAYVEGLRAFPRERLLARMDALLENTDDRDRDDALVGLRAYPDEARVSQLARDPELCLRLGVAGPPAIPALRAALAEVAPDSERALDLRYAITSAAWDAPVLDPEWDELFSSRSSVFSRLIERLPLERRDRVVRAHLDDERIESVKYVLRWVSDPVLDEALGKLLARDPLPDLTYTFGTLGARATQPLIKHLEGAPPARVAEVVNVSRLPDDVAERLLGGKRHTPLPIVAGDICDGASFLALVAPHLAAASPAVQLKLGAGRIAIGEYGVEGRRVLGRRVPAGSYPVTLYYKDDPSNAYDGMPTAGLEAVMVRFRDTLPVDWVEATDEDGETLLGGDEFAFFLADEKRIEKNAKVVNDAIEGAFEDSYVDGLAVADLPGDGDSASSAVVFYIGECCRQNGVFWGLDGEREPAVLIAAFQYV